MRDATIDALKGAAIIGAVAIHVLTAGRGASVAEIVLLGIATRFSTPAFFFASGWLNRPRPGEKPLGFVIKRARRLALPYIIWAAAGIAFYLSFRGWPGWQVVTWGLVSGQVPGAYQLYFLPALLQCYPLLYLSKRGQVAVAAVSFASLAAMDAAVIMYPAAAGAVIAAARSTFLPWAGYFLLGRLLREEGFDPRRVSLPLLAAGSAAGLVVLAGNIVLDLRLGAPAYAAADFFKPGAALYAAPVTLLIFALAARLGALIRPLAALGYLSGGVFFSFTAVLWVLGIALPGLFAPGLLVPATLAALAVSALLAMAVRRAGAGRVFFATS